VGLTENRGPHSIHWLIITIQTIHHKIAIWGKPLILRHITGRPFPSGFVLTHHPHHKPAEYEISQQYIWLNSIYIGIISGNSYSNLAKFQYKLVVINLNHQPENSY
jgi:hypothetical protein